MSNVTFFGHNVAVRHHIALMLMSESGVRITCSSFQASYSVNGIPRAVCTVATGRDAWTGQVSEANLAFVKGIATERTDERFAVILQMGRAVGDPHPRTYVIFEGYAVGVGVRTARGAGQMVIHLQHWLCDLDASSVFSRRGHVANPMSLANPSLYMVRDALATAEQGTYVTHAVGDRLFTPELITKDLWSSIHQLFWDISEEDFLDPEPIKARGVRGIHGEAQKNDRAQRALRRIPGGKNSFVQENPYPLSLDEMDAVNHNPVLNKIIEFCNSRTIESFWQSTMWGALIEQLAASLQFAVIPRARDALVVPFAMGARQPGRTMLAVDYQALDVSGRMEQLLGLVAVYANESWITDVFDPEGDSISFGGHFPDHLLGNGNILAIPPPAWLDDLRFPSRNIVPAEQVLRPNVGDITKEEPIAADAIRREAGANVQAINNIYDRYAQAIFVQEATRGRQATCQSIFWDVTPGTTVIIPRYEDPAIYAQLEAALRNRWRDGNFDDIPGEALPQTGLDGYVGTLVQNDYFIDAETSKFHGTYHLTNVRTESENRLDIFSLSRHMIYEQLYNGAHPVHGPDRLFYELRPGESPFG